MFMDWETHNAKIFLNLTYRFIAISIKITKGFLIDINSHNFMWEGKETRTPKTIWKEQNQVGHLTCYYFISYYKTEVIKTTWYWKKDRHAQNRIQK